MEKEAYEEISTLYRINSLTVTPDSLDLYTDHNNSLFLVEPLPVVSDLSLTSFGNLLLRWVVRQSMYKNLWCHIKGEVNVRDDLISR